MKPGYILKTWFEMDFVFPHWTLYGLFWVSLVLVPVPMSFAHHSGPISYKTGLALGTYLIFIFCLVYMLAAFMGYKYTHTHGGVKNYAHQRHKIVAAALPIGAATLYFTGYLITIPFGHAPNYVFTLKPSPQLEMELNHLLGDDTIEYTPFDYSLDEQEITYVTDGVDSSRIEVIDRNIYKPDKIATLSKEDINYLFSINTITPFHLGIRHGKCVIIGQVEEFSTREISHTSFKTPITISRSEHGEMLIDTKGMYFISDNQCSNEFIYNPELSDPLKRFAITAYVLYPNIYRGIIDYDIALRRKLNFSLEHFDNAISNF